MPPLVSSFRVPAFVPPPPPPSPPTPHHPVSVSQVYEDERADAGEYEEPYYGSEEEGEGAIYGADGQEQPPYGGSPQSHGSGRSSGRNP